MLEKTWEEILNELTVTHGNDLSRIDKLDIVSFCLEIEEKSKVAETYLKSIKPTRKDSAVALQKKCDGNKKLLEKKYKESFLSYTESIFHAESDDESLPLAYANRSLALQQMGHLKESLNDIDMAIICGYPKEKFEKLKNRKAKLLKQSKVQREWRSSKKNFDMIKLFGTPDKPEYKLPKVKGGENKDFASASVYLNVYFSETKGRHVIATKDFKIGEVLFVEKAFAFVVCQEACFNCLQRVVAPIPCEKCLDVTYCSLECRNDSWKSAHFFQCGFGELFKSVGIAHLGLQVILAASSSLDELKSKLKNISEPEYKSGLVSFRCEDYEKVYNLVHHMDKHEASDLLQYCMTALLLAKYMKNHTSYFPKTSKDEDLKLLTSLILRHILQMICNGHAIMEAMVRGEKTSVIFEKAECRIATAIFPSVSMMNHSCLPSVMIGFYKDYIIVQAEREIKKGEEVFNCYSADARRMKRTLRQKILNEQYFFKCECEVCTQTFDIQDKFVAFKCAFCKGPFIPKAESSLEGICIDCMRESEISVESILKNNEFYSLLKKGELLMQRDVNLSLKTFLKAWKLGREIFYRFHKDLGYAADAAAKCLATLQDYERCFSFLKCCIVSVEERFGLFTTEYISELNKLLDVQLAVLSSGKKDGDFLRELYTYQRKNWEIISVIDGNPHANSERITFLEEMLKGFN